MARPWGGAGASSDRPSQPSVAVGVVPPELAEIAKAVAGRARPGANRSSGASPATAPSASGGYDTVLVRQASAWAKNRDKCSN